MNAFETLLQSLEACPAGQEDNWALENVEGLNASFHRYLNQQEAAARLAGELTRAARLLHWFKGLKTLVAQRTMRDYLKTPKGPAQVHYAQTYSWWLLNLEANAILHEWESQTAEPDTSYRTRLVWQAIQDSLNAEPTAQAEALQSRVPFSFDIAADSMFDAYVNHPDVDPATNQKVIELKPILLLLRTDYEHYLLQRLAHSELDTRTTIVYVRALLCLTLEPVHHAKLLFKLGEILRFLPNLGRSSTLHLLEAIHHCERAQRILVLSQADALCIMGTARFMLNSGDPSINASQALAIFKQARRLYRKYDEFVLLADTLVDMGIVHSTLPTKDGKQNRPRAMKYFQQALQVFPEKGPALVRARILDSLAGAHVHMGTPSESEAAQLGIIYYTEAKSIYEQLIRSESSDEKVSKLEARWAITMSNLGSVYLHLALRTKERAHYISQAINCLESALNVSDRLGLTQSNTLTALARCYSNLPNSSQNVDRAKVESYYRRGIIQYPVETFPQYRGHFALGLGRLLVDKEQYVEAMEPLQQAEQAFDNLWTDTSQKIGKERLAQQNSELYQLLVLCCLREDQFLEAFRYVTKAKGRAFVDALSSVRLDLNQAASKNQKFAGDLAKLRALWSRTEAVQRLLLGQDQGTAADLGGNRAAVGPAPVLGKEDRAVWQQELAELYKQQKETSERLSRRYPQLFATQTAPTLTAKQAQELAARLGAPLVEYYRHAKGWVAFIVRAEDIKVIELTDQADHIAATMQQDWMAHINTFNSRPWSPRRTDTNEADLTAFAEAFIWPLLEHLPADGPLVLAPNQIMHGLPLQAAPLPPAYGGGQLVERYAISFMPSLAAVAVRDRQRTRDHTTAPIATPTGQARLLAVSCPLVGHPRHLPHVTAEVEAVKAQFDQSHTIWLHEHAHEEIQQATAARLIAECQRQPPTVLYAGCHGVFSAANPQHSGLLLQDGALFDVEHILNELPLQGVALVALAACRSGQAHIGEGDELVGLPQAMLTAGADMVLASQWVVDDAATRCLIEAFFQAWQGQGRSAAQALQYATQQVRQHTRWQHPYYWAAFRLMNVPSPTNQ